jgi:aspartate/methionine/tyrosine aminotransferase
VRSSRLPSDLSLNATTRTLDALRRRGIEVVDLTASNPTRVGLRYPDDLLSALADPAALVYDPQPLGSRAAREAVSADFARRALTVPTDRIALTASTSEAYAWLFKLFCDAGDSVLVLLGPAIRLRASDGALEPWKRVRIGWITTGTGASIWANWP